MSGPVEGAPSPEESAKALAWVEAHRNEIPLLILAIVLPYLKLFTSKGARRNGFSSAAQELRRALGITPSSEKRPSGSALAGTPREAAPTPATAQEKLQAEMHRGERLRGWHRDLERRHGDKLNRLAARLVEMLKNRDNDERPSVLRDTTPLEDIELTPEALAEVEAGSEEFAANLRLGNGADPAFESVNETLMPTGAVLAHHAQAKIAAPIPAEFADAKVIETLTDRRVRYDFSMSVTRIDLDVEKKIVEDASGERHVLTGSTAEYGPPRYSVTWEALATLAILVSQFALPFHRLARMLSTAGKRFTSATLSRMLHYVAERLAPIYLELAHQVSSADILAGDDTSCRVLEVRKHFSKPPTGASPPRVEEPPWSRYRTRGAADEAFRECERKRASRVLRRDNGDREATPSREETPSLGVLTARVLGFESPRRDGTGSKQSLNTTVISGRRFSAEPRSLIVFYRSHLGSCGNLFESLLSLRDRRLREVTLQGDLSPTNRVFDPDLLTRFDVTGVGCTAHARRPFANYAHEDPERCDYMLHLFCGLSMYEKILSSVGRNRENVLAIRAAEIRELWDKILRLAKDMAEIWSASTRLGAGARTIINHFDALTGYVKNPHLEATNNLRERMLRIEKLIEASSMFRKSLEGRFVLDIVRTVLQTAVASGVPVQRYLVSVLRSSPDEISRDPSRFTPLAWSEAQKSVAASAQPSASTPF